MHAAMVVLSGVRVLPTHDRAPPDGPGAVLGTKYDNWRAVPTNPANASQPWTPPVLEQLPAPFDFRLGKAGPSGLVGRVVLNTRSDTPCPA